ncbi:MAG: addiction module protein [Taibaiella sp.]|nr:addiction module protein [Taibaiella sp.]
MSQIYRIRTKKEYAAGVIEDLCKNDAVVLVPEEEAFDVPQWQKEEVRKRIEKYKQNPELLVSEKVFFDMRNEE